jgi:hypothetical protein
MKKLTFFYYENLKEFKTMITILEQSINCLFKNGVQNVILPLNFDNGYRLFMERTGGGVFLKIQLLFTLILIHLVAIISN